MKGFTEHNSSPQKLLQGLMPKVLLLALVLGVLAVLSLLASLSAEAGETRGGGASDGGRSACFNPGDYLRRNVDPSGDLNRDLHGLVLGVQIAEARAGGGGAADGGVSRSFADSAKRSIERLRTDLPAQILAGWTQSGCAGTGGRVSFGGQSLAIVESSDTRLVLEGGWVFTARTALSVQVERNTVLTHTFRCNALKTVQESHEVQIAIAVDLDVPPSLSNPLASFFADTSPPELDEERKAACEARP